MLYSLKSRINSRDTTSKIAARITANCDPIPPSTTIASTNADSAKVKDSGLTKPWRAANSVPAKPANAALMVKAVSLIRRGLKPSERQAISSSRNASHARPSGIRSRRLMTNRLSTTSSNATRYRKMTRSEGSYFRPKKLLNVSQPPSRAVRLNSRPKKVGFGI